MSDNYLNKSVFWYRPDYKFFTITSVFEQDNRENNEIMLSTKDKSDIYRAIYYLAFKNFRHIHFPERVKIVQ